MARKKKHPEHVNHERWLVSYADFITLLFAFFVVMFAVSQVDSKKVGRFTQSFKEALEWAPLTQKSGGGGGDRVIAELSAMANHTRPSWSYSNEKKSIKKNLGERLGKVPSLSGLNILEVHGELVLRLPEKLMFDRGEAAISPGGKEALDAIADELRTRPVRIRVEGHTDATPIHTARFPSNWELSMARAMAVVRFCLETAKIEPGRLAAAGYGEYHPVGSNDSAEGRAQNRRVDLIVVADFEHEGDLAQGPTEEAAPSHEGNAVPKGEAEGAKAGEPHRAGETKP
jgi:chemotaxis protein MotB